MGSCRVSRVVSGCGGGCPLSCADRTVQGLLAHRAGEWTPGQWTVHEPRCEAVTGRERKFKHSLIAAKSNFYQSRLKEGRAAEVRGIAKLGAW